MRRHASVSRYDIGILVLCLVFGLVSVGAVGSRGRTRAREAVCRAYLGQWGSVFDSFTRDHDNLFFRSEPGIKGTWWIEALWPYHEDAGLLLCPSAPDFSPDSPPAYLAWRTEGYTGSYGLSGGISDSWPDTSRDRYTPFWRTPRVWGAERVPVLADMFWVGAWPHQADTPPATEQQFPAAGGGNEMQRVCINRHEGSVNVLFMDWSVRKVGLKELWTLQWSKQFNTRGPWTTAGGVRPEDWPKWMRAFKDSPGFQDD